MILAINMEMIGLSIAIFLGIILVLVILLLVAKNYLSPSGPVKVTLNGEKEIEVASGGSLLGSLSAEGVFLPSACGGKGSCGQCRCQVTEGGGEILPTETVHFSRKQIKDNWRLGCQVKVKNNMRYESHQYHLSGRAGHGSLSILLSMRPGFRSEHDKDGFMSQA